MHDKKRCQRGDVPVLCVFGRTKHGVKKLARQLADTGYPVAALQGNLSQNARNASWLTSAPDGCPSCCWRAAGIDRRAARSTDSGGRHDAHDNAAPVQGYPPTLWHTAYAGCSAVASFASSPRDPYSRLALPAGRSVLE